MTMIVEHDATVIPLTDALLRSPKRAARHGIRDGGVRLEGALPDNVIVLARVARRRRAPQRFLPGSPPDGEAA
jgi:hypothetical protein